MLQTGLYRRQRSPERTGNSRSLIIRVLIDAANDQLYDMVENLVDELDSLGEARIVEDRLVRGTPADNKHNIDLESAYIFPL